MAMVLRFSNDYGSIEEDVELRLIRYWRNGVLFPSLEEIRVCFSEMGLAMDRVGRRDKALLVDLRDAHGSNDPSFEEAMGRARKKMIHSFTAVAVLVKTAAGALQMRRHAAEDGRGMRVFQDEAEALAFLTNPSEPPPRLG